MIKENVFLTFKPIRPKTLTKYFWHRRTSAQKYFMSLCKVLKIVMKASQSQSHYNEVAGRQPVTLFKKTLRKREVFIIFFEALHNFNVSKINSYLSNWDSVIDTLSANPTKWSNAFKTIYRLLPTNFSSVTILWGLHLKD